ncbi:hypothetical protein JF729_18470 [Mycobacterium intracellulare]|uniref:hypothetical protein n=1 Tax=Mycobacterium intracellulare TaxID=1767 RepID=UPI001CDA03A1|nr:hypothetical protein [Mycobacterium intracellulare]MCA2249765.1 hypothetical protein [Mycobacterium intracellulare]
MEITEPQRWVVEIVDPSDPDVVHTFEGTSEADVDAQVENAFGVGGSVPLAGPEQ